jgi:hypothetical protein
VIESGIFALVIYLVYNIHMNLAQKMKVVALFGTRAMSVPIKYLNRISTRLADVTHKGRNLCRLPHFLPSVLLPLTESHLLRHPRRHLRSRRDACQPHNRHDTATQVLHLEIQGHRPETFYHHHDEAKWFPYQCKGHQGQSHVHVR